uniref:Uncharacterized protein n=1 Tax=Oryza punctata TaxID=4537 RepID=A0A0E0LGC6_ORYPU
MCWKYSRLKSNRKVARILCHENERVPTCVFVAAAGRRRRSFGCGGGGVESIASLLIGWGEVVELGWQESPTCVGAAAAAVDRQLAAPPVADGEALGAAASASSRSRRDTGRSIGLELGRIDQWADSPGSPFEMLKV